MLLGCIADDFTGAGDLANTLARGEMQTRLFVGEIPADDPGCDAGVIALKTRSIDPAEAVRQSLAALAQLRTAGCRQILFKYCSTFDSTRQGNIGPVAEALASALNATGVIVCPAFPATGRTVYQGNLFVGDVPLSESGMARHPLTPMTDSDIRRWLAHQSRATPGHVPHPIVRQGPDAIRAALAASAALLVVVDAVSDADLRAIGQAAMTAPLITGGSGVALALPDNFRSAGLLTDQPSRFVGNDAPALVLSGSCSIATRAQVDAYAASHPAQAIDVDRLIAGEPVQAEAEAFVDRHRGQAPLIYSTAAPERVKAMQGRHGSETSAGTIERLFGALAAGAVARGFGRIVVAGGETSGAVVSALDIAALDIGAEIDPGVPALSAPAGRPPLALALKSGNFGATDFLHRAVLALAA